MKKRKADKKQKQLRLNAEKVRDLQAIDDAKLADAAGGRLRPTQCGYTVDNCV